MLENLKKYWWLHSIVVALIGGSGWLISQGYESHEKDSRLFTTPEKRIETEKYFQQRPSAAQEQRQLLLDSFAAVKAIENAEHAKKSRAIRDSLFEVERKARKITDSILLLNADQVYQIKEELKRIKQQ
jgi:hypothetical protein